MAEDSEIELPAVYQFSIKAGVQTFVTPRLSRKFLFVHGFDTASLYFFDMRVSGMSPKMEICHRAEDHW
jgi:hypothetical protein